MEYLEDLLLKGEINPLIKRRFNLDHLGAAQAYVDSGHKVGNVIVMIK